MVQTCEMVRGDVVAGAANHKGIEEIFGAGVAGHFAIAEAFERETTPGNFIEAVVANRGVVHAAGGADGSGQRGA